MDLCLNCKHTLNSGDKFCPVCGQEVKGVKISVRELLSQFFSDLFTFDSKLFRSIKPLLLRPGFLTNEYNAGHRMRYIPPLRMYIFISIIYFFALSLMSQDSKEPAITINKKTSDEPIEFVFGDKKETLNPQSVLHAYETGTESQLLDSIGVAHTPFSEFMVKVGTKQYVKMINSSTGFMQYLRKIVSFAMFLVMPVMGLFLLLFYHSKSNWYIDHLIFSFHIHSVLFLVLTITLFTALVSEWFKLLAAAYVIWHFFKALRNVYGEKRGITILKMSGLAMAGGAVLIITLLSSVVFSFFLF